MRRTPLQRKTPLRQVSLARAALKPARPAVTGPDANTVDAVLERDQHSCGCCGAGLSGMRGRDWSIQHRRPRRMGGDTRPDTNMPCNLFAVCGDGTSGCHGHLESHRADAIAMGWLLHAGDVPSQSPILLSMHGWVYLTDDCRIELVPPPVLRGLVIDLGGYVAGPTIGGAE